jgi:predicted Zn-dependent protease
VKNRTLFFKFAAIALIGAAPLLQGCHRLRSLLGLDTAQAYADYQSATAAGDIAGARIALLKLVTADEDNPDYWTELGKIDLQLGDYSGAYDALSHAHDLDRTNVEVLAALTQLALMARQVPLADEQAKTLALLAPNHPVVTLVRGYVALDAGDLDKADAAANGLLESNPAEPNAKILKARILIARRRIDDAIALLEAQHASVPNDRAAIRALTSLYSSRDDWKDVARIQYDFHKLDPNDGNVSKSLTQALLRTGDVAAAAAVSKPLLAASSSAQLMEETLEAWAKSAPPQTAVPDAITLANAVAGERRVIFANYFNEIGKPAIATALLGNSKLPVRPTNARWNAVFAQSLALQGRLPEAKQLFDLVLDEEPDQIDALRGRSLLEARTGMAKQAIVDAQRLISVTPKTGEDRLLLARAYLAAGNRNDVRRTLWQAFQDLPGDERVLEALKNVLISTGDLDGAKRASDEFADNRIANLQKDLV